MQETMHEDSADGAYSVVSRTSRSTELRHVGLTEMLPRQI